MSRPLPVMDHTQELKVLRSKLTTLESSIASAEAIVEFDYPRGHTPASVEAMRDRLKVVQEWFDTTPPHLRATHSLIELDNLRHRIGILDNYRSMSAHIVKKQTEAQRAEANALRTRIAVLERG